MEYTIFVSKNWLLRNGKTAHDAALELSARSELNIDVRARSTTPGMGDMSTYSIADSDITSRIRAAWLEWVSEL